MWCLNEDILFMIFEELNKNNRKSLHSCLLVNRTWCITVIPILWKNPGQSHITEYLKNKLFDVIFLHLSEESKNTLKIQGINNHLINKYQFPSFNYINFWKYLDLGFLEEVISSNEIENSIVPIVKNEILRLFINRNIKFIHLGITSGFNYQLHVIPGAEYCFSELETFYCHAEIDQSILEGLARICKSIKKFTLDVYHYTDGSGIIKLIEEQKKLNNVSFIKHPYSRNNKFIDDNNKSIKLYTTINRESFHKSLEESLIDHADTVQYLEMCWLPVTRILSRLVNLISLDIRPYFTYTKYESENVALPLISPLKILKVYKVPRNFLTNIIGNTTGNLTEIWLHYDGIDSKILFQAISHNCPNLRYLQLSLINNINSFIPELEGLLNNCQLLNELIIYVENIIFDKFQWDKLFIILAKSSPINLFKFKFYTFWMCGLNDIKLFLDNWENENSISLEICYSYNFEERLEDLLKDYKANGVIKKYCYSLSNLNIMTNPFTYE